MNIIAVDNEHYALEALADAIEKVAKGSTVSTFVSPLDALEHAKENKVDVAFLDIDMPGMNGLILAKHLKDIHGRTNIVFVTSHSQYANNAFGMYASGYVMKPINPERVQIELAHLRNPVETPMAKVHFQCFGSFAVFVDGKALLFSRAKPKELLAYLVHKRGASASPAEIAAVLWEDKEYNRSLKSNTQNVIAQLMKVLRDNNIEDIVSKAWNNMAINVSLVSCDYYDALTGNVDALNAYTGEYMHEYSWAEFSIGKFDDKVKP